VEPQGAGVTMQTLVADQPTLAQTVLADGSAHVITDGPCRGTERAQWSTDGLRLFSSATLTCPGEADRTVSGMVLFSTADTWIDVQGVTVASRESVRVRHYRRSASQVAGQATGATARARTPASRMTIDDVTEASTRVSTGALEAALIESRTRFSLSGKTLLTLDDAGVPDSVTDLMVALSYPQAFVVERTSRDDRLTSVDPYGYMGMFGAGDAFWPYGSDLGYGSYYDSGYYYSPFGYSYLRNYPLVFGGGGVIAAGGGSGGGRPAQPQEPGRVINGLGYTRVMTTRDAETVAGADTGGSARSTSSGRGRVTTQGYSDGGSSSGGSNSGSSSGSGASSGGTSSGNDSGRTAVPR
jgi:hypothetical protein